MFRLIASSSSASAAATRSGIIVSNVGRRIASAAAVTAGNTTFGTSLERRQDQQVVSSKSRSFATKPPGSDPLDVIRDECLRRNLCDEHGYRRPGVHWVFSVAVTPNDPNQPPNLRTIGVQRVSSDGIDFVMKKGSVTCDALASGRPIAMLHLQGRYMPGETAEQWRGEGYCERIQLPELLDRLPHYTINGMVSSKRMEKEKEIKNQIDDLHEGVSDDRLIMENKSHMTEIMQKTRIELENGDISDDEIDAAIRAFRFHPTRLECMAGGPDKVLWTRWEWQKDQDGFWNEPKALLPH